MTFFLCVTVFSATFLVTTFLNATFFFKATFFVAVVMEEAGAEAVVAATGVTA